MPLISLPEVFDRTTVPATREAILAMRQDELVLDASGVRRVSALGIEMLIATQRQWAQDGQRLAIEPSSAAFDETVAQLGLTAEDFCAGVPG